jgi:membrane protein
MSFISIENSRCPISELSRRWCRYGSAVVHKEFARWLWRRVWLDDIPGTAAQLSYYFLFSLFLICLSALLGYFFAAGGGLARRLLEYLGAVMPSAAFNVVIVTANDLLRTRGGGKLSFGLLLALWLASSGMEAVIEGLNVAFQVGEARPWWRRRLVALGLTVTVALLAGGAFGLMLAGGWGGKALMDLVGFGDVWSPLWRAMQWIGSILFLLIAINLVYFFGPNLKARRRTQVIVPGAIVALIGSITASAGLRHLLDHFSSLGITYGSIGAVIALLLWLYLTGAALLVGAEMNSGIQSRLRETRD